MSFDGHSNNVKYPESFDLIEAMAWFPVSRDSSPVVILGLLRVCLRTWKEKCTHEVWKNECNMGVSTKLNRVHTCLAACTVAGAGGLWIGWWFSNSKFGGSVPEEWLMRELRMPPEQVAALRSMKYGCPNIDGLRKHGNIIVSFDTCRRNPRWVYEHFVKFPDANARSTDSGSHAQSSRNSDTFLTQLHKVSGSSAGRSNTEEVSPVSRSNSRFYEDSSFEPDFRNRLEDFRYATLGSRGPIVVL